MLKAPQCPEPRVAIWLLIILLTPWLIITPSNTDANTILWTRQFGASGADLAYPILADVTGIYVAGQTGGALPGQSSAGLADAFVARYDQAGNQLWVRQFGTPGLDGATAMTSDATGIYVAGVANGAPPGESNAALADAFVAKYDREGNQIWVRQFGTPGEDGVVSARADATGIYMAGLVRGALLGQNNAGGYDAFLAKYDHEGKELWTRQFGTPGTDSATTVAIYASGVYVGGIASGALFGHSYAGGYDAFLAKYDGEGKKVWTRQFGTPEDDSAHAVTAHATGVHVTGVVNGAFPGQHSSGLPDVFLGEYDQEGNQLWLRQFGTSGIDSANAMAADAAGIYLAGSTSGALPGQSSAGGHDAFVGQFDHKGKELWTFQFGTAGLDSALGVALDATGMYLAGSTSGALFGQGNAGGLDAFMVKTTRGSELLCAGQAVTLLGTDGDDVLIGTPERDVISGLGGNDTINGGWGDDLVCAGDGHDIVNGGWGADIVHGQAGDDWVAGGWGEGDAGDIVSGGLGHDFVFGGDGDDRLWGGAGRDFLYGGAGDDILHGNGSWDRLRGGPGDDTLDGGPANDFLYGEEGDDATDGGEDFDVCQQGPGDGSVVNCEG